MSDPKKPTTPKPAEARPTAGDPADVPEAEPNGERFEYLRRIRELVSSGNIKMDMAVDEHGMNLHDRRVDFILEHFQQGRWLWGVTDRVLAKEWRCSTSTVARLASNAAALQRRDLRMDEDARHEATAIAVQSFARLAWRAEAMAVKKNDAYALSVARACIETWTRYMGVAPKQQIEVTDGNPFAGWSKAELEEYTAHGRIPPRIVRRNMAVGLADREGEPGQEPPDPSSNPT